MANRMDDKDLAFFDHVAFMYKQAAKTVHLKMVGWIEYSQMIL